MISLSNLLASGGVTAASYDSTASAIRLTPAIDSTVNLLKENYLLSSNYNPLYYKNKTAYMEANYENGEWVYTAKSVSSQGGIMRMILDVYQQYGAGEYTLSFEYKSNVKLTVALGKDHDFVSVGTANSSSSEYTLKTLKFTLTDDPAELDQLAICFKIPIKENWFRDDEPGTLSIRNISLVKIN
jgi:hypothetical protein